MSWAVYYSFIVELIAYYGTGFYQAASLIPLSIRIQYVQVRKNIKEVKYGVRKERESKYFLSKL